MDIDKLLSDETTETTPEIRRQVIEKQIQQWMISLEDARIGYRTFVALGDEQMKSQARKAAERCIKAIEHLKSEMPPEVP